MLGRVRASPLSVECLELERLPSKLLKDDSLSIYEATLMKLKQGSRRVVSLPDEMEAEVALDLCKLNAISAESMSSNLSSANEGAVKESLLEKFSQNDGGRCNSDSDSSISTTQESRNMSILYMFSKYKQSNSCELKGMGLQDDVVMVTDEEGSLTDDSTSFSDCEITRVLSKHTLS